MQVLQLYTGLFGRKLPVDFSAPVVSVVSVVCPSGRAEAVRLRMTVPMPEVSRPFTVVERSDTTG